LKFSLKPAALEILPSDAILVIYQNASNPARKQASCIVDLKNKFS